jgi:Gp37 protein
MSTPQPTLPTLIDPTAWSGRTYSPELPLDLATAQTAIVGQLQTPFAATPIQVFGYPDLPDDGWWSQTQAPGYVLVAYDSTEFGPPIATSSMVQERRIDFEVLIIARQIAWGDFGPTGVMQALIKVIKAQLTGFRIPGFRNGYFTGERFREKDPQGRIWVYAMRWRTITMEVKMETKYALAALQALIYNETGGLTTVPVAIKPYVFVNGVIQLPNTNVSAVSVTSIANNAPYVLGTDYSLQAAQGTIAALAGGALANGGTVNVTYSYSDVNEVTYPAGEPTGPLATPNT